MLSIEEIGRRRFLSGEFDSRTERYNAAIRDMRARTFLNSRIIVHILLNHNITTITPEEKSQIEKMFAVDLDF